MAIETAQDTRQRILEAAEKFYAERGFDGTSLRSLTDAAGVNLAAVNYHFGSKKSLMWEMFRARVVPLNDERLRLLDEAIAAPGGPTLETIYNALLEPTFDAAKTADGAPNVIFLRMIGRVFSESEEFWQALHEEFFEEVSNRFLAALEQAMPELDPGELAWRHHFAIATMLGTLVTHESMCTNCVKKVDGKSLDETCQRLLHFTCAGFRATGNALDK
ncbi:MAG: TetR/AcrR family transcriptional regulator [Puniceicoccales bacterium]